jgi:hypothetical protein
MCVKICIKI